eukprot:gb/GECH01012769.1/.p1 GENE.gb/GECH01012769.1/~~gb/GECH01012769.1/.p1  ORF type:complete len:466 (+),score=47.16 gb/GECH01012769.1/:1-1398(+)
MQILHTTKKKKIVIYLFLALFSWVVLNSIFLKNTGLVPLEDVEVTYLSPESSLNQILEGLNSYTIPPNFLFIIPQGFEVSDKAIARARETLINNDPMLSVVGVGQEEPKSMFIDKGVLWIKEEKKASAYSECVDSDITEQPFLIRESTMRQFLSEPANNSTLIELFYSIKTKGMSLLTCKFPQVKFIVEKRRSDFRNHYKTASISFQLKYKIRNVINEKLDDFNRSHLDHHNILYCNTTTSKIFENRFHSKKVKKVNLHSPRDTLVRWKKVLDEFNLPLIIGFGTLLGWIRECDFMSHTSDIDTVLPITVYRGNLPKVAKKHGFKLFHSYGTPPKKNKEPGGYELTFIDKRTKNRLDVFHAYEDQDGKQWTSLWVEESLRRAYFYPKTFTNVIPADFNGIQVHVPRDFEITVVTSYGPKWFEPVSRWKWDSSAWNIYRGPFDKSPRNPKINFPPKYITEYRRHAN